MEAITVTETATPPSNAGNVPPRGNAPGFYRPELDSLRFFAFLLVFLCHSISAESGWLSTLRSSASLGVCLFFLLSAYLISELLERERVRFGDFRLGAFYARRALRIWPLAFGLLFTDFAIEHALHPATFSVARLLAFSLMAGNIYFGFHGFTMSMSAPLWSISIEEQFYLIWPTAKRVLTRKALIALCLFVYALSFGALYYLGRQPVVNKAEVWVNSLVQFQYFATGCLLAMGLRGRIPRYPAALRCAAFGLGLVAMFSAQAIFHFKDGPDPVTFASLAGAYLLGNIACLLFFLSILGEERVGRWGPIVYLGKISYGLYIFHWVVLRMVTRSMDAMGGRLGVELRAILTPLLALGLTIAIASLSYKFFETPILRYKRRFERVKTRPV